MLLLFHVIFLQVNEGVRSQENTDRLEWLQTHVNLESIGEVGILDFVCHAFAVFSRWENLWDPRVTAIFNLLVAIYIHGRRETLRERLAQELTDPG